MNMDGSHAGQGCAYGDPCHRIFGQRCIEITRSAKFIVQSRCRPVHAFCIVDSETEDENAVVPRHFLTRGLVEGFCVAELAAG